MNGFGFIEYKDAMDARDVVPGELPRTHVHGFGIRAGLARHALTSARCMLCIYAHVNACFCFAGAVA